MRPTDEMCYCRKCNFIDPVTGFRGRRLDKKRKKAHDQDEAFQRVLESPTPKHGIPDEVKAHLAEQTLDEVFGIHYGSSTGVRPSSGATERSNTPRSAKDFRQSVAGIFGRISDGIRDINELLAGQDPVDSNAVSAGMTLYHQIRGDFALLSAQSHRVAKLMRGSSTLAEYDKDLTDCHERLQAAELLNKKKELQAERAQDIPTVDTSEKFRPLFINPNPITILITYMVLVSHVVLWLPLRGGHWIFDMARIILQQVTQGLSERLDEQVKPSVLSFWDNLFRVLPRDVSNSVKNFHLDSKYTVYAVCPVCHRLYPPVADSELSTGASYPEKCRGIYNFKSCPAPLMMPSTRKGITRMVPIKTFLSYDFHEWLGGLLSRRGIEDTLDARWDELKHSPLDPMTDVFHGSLIREFSGPDGRHFSVPSEEGEGRYLFAAGFDNFNPLSNKAAGKKMSVGVIFLVCLNFPLSERYQPENIFLAGLIPGPYEPPLECTNPYFEPFVRAFLVLWTTGVFLTRTYNFDFGRLIRAALVLIICDALAARKIGGYVSANHRRFCTVCWCRFQTADDILLEQARATVATAEEAERKGQVLSHKHKKAFEKAQLLVNRDSQVDMPGDTPGVYQGYEDFAVHTWTTRSRREVVDWAGRYSAAKDSKEQEWCTNKSGIRTSPLLDLPYFDPARMIVVDSMHNLFLGLIKRLIRDILGFRVKKKRTDEAQVRVQAEVVCDITLRPTVDNPLPASEKTVKKVNSIMFLLKTTATDDLLTSYDAIYGKLCKMPKPALLFVAQMLENRTIEGTRDHLASIMLTWRLNQELPSDPPSNEFNIGLGECFSNSDIENAWNGFENICKPSWMPSLPHRMGDNTGQSKLKADVWRTFGLSHFPILIVMMWSSSSPQKQAVLAMAMHLLTAISLATSYQMTPALAEESLQSLMQYRSALQRMFPSYNYTPNDHLAFHIPQFLQLFGPVPGWWAFPFERSIGMMERIPANYKPNEYEDTISRSFHRMSNIRLLHGQKGIEHIVQLCSQAFDRLTRSKRELDETLQEHAGNGISIGRITSPLQTLGSAQIAAFGRSDESWDLPRAHTLAGLRFQPFKHFFLHGKSISTAQSHLGNSRVVLKGSVSSSPCEIQQLLYTPASKTAYAIVKKFVPLKWGTTNPDPFAKFPTLRTGLFETAMDACPVAIPIQMIEAHCIVIPKEWSSRNVLAIQSLSRNQAATALLNDRFADREEGDDM